MMRDKIIEYVQKKYGVEPVFPWDRDPDSGVLKHKKNKKWFALFMRIPGKRIDLDTDEMVDIMNVKAVPDMVASLNQQRGFAPAYHMNKTHWLTIILDGEVTLESVYVLLDESFELTK
ncbi:MAG: MmcQ/YjbR family DNA-binding protein [Lachnospiraceae bacterium]|nr:MmcQ/YjbR family DNA-binding protein [Lachnospiraceae bacterium]